MIGRLSFCLYDENAVRYFILALATQVPILCHLQVYILPAVLPNHLTATATNRARTQILCIACKGIDHILDLLMAAVTFIDRFLHW